MYVVNDTMTLYIHTYSRYIGIRTVTLSRRRPISHVCPYMLYVCFVFEMPNDHTPRLHTLNEILYPMHRHIEYVFDIKIPLPVYQLSIFNELLNNLSSTNGFFRKRRNLGSPKCSIIINYIKCNAKKNK